MFVWAGRESEQGATGMVGKCLFNPSPALHIQVSCRCQSSIVPFNIINGDDDLASANL